ncbi:hypothetical protein [Nocardioides aurantiacus]|uniref:hypothetical protein n=1 Tax=Nocardioides aurantiacus TaxID=86796 RepID=UPI00403F6734
MPSPRSADREGDPAPDGVLGAGPGPDDARVCLDRPVLVGNLVSGGGWLLAPMVITASYGAWPLSLFGAGYVVAASVFLAAVYGRGPMSWSAEALAWVTPWLVAVASWAVLTVCLESRNLAAAQVPESSVWVWGLWWGAVIATPLYLLWQLSALAVRLLYVHAGGGSSPAR